MLLTSSVIQARYDLGINYLTNITFGKYLKDRYAVQYKNTITDRHLIMWLFAVDTWDSTPGAINWLTQTQLMSILDAINGAHSDGLTRPITLTSSISNCNGSSNTTTTSVIRVSDTASIHLSFVNGVLSASLVVSDDMGNLVVVQGDGVFASGGVASPQPPFITANPVGASVLVGEDFTMITVATGYATLLYQWQKNGVNISGATNNYYTITNVSAGNEGSYTCVVTNGVGSVTSLPAVLATFTSGGGGGGGADIGSGTF